MSKTSSGPTGSSSAATAPSGPVSAIKSIETVIVHPLVLLSVTDHYARVAKDTKNKRVVGVLLGETEKGKVHITNSFAIPFEDDPRDPNIFFLDHDYLENMASMFRKVSIRERILGFYSTGPKIRPTDIDIDRVFKKYCPHPVLVVVDVRPDVEGLPIQAYVTIEEVKEGFETERVFTYVPSEVGASEAEEVGVEHLLRDINDPSVGDLGVDIRHKRNGLQGLVSRLTDISEYLQLVLDGKMPVQHEILASIQTLLTMLPNTNVEPLPTSIAEMTNDKQMVVYIARLAMAVTGLHDLVLNRQKFKESEIDVFQNTAKGKAGKETKESKEEPKEVAATKSESGKDKSNK